MMTLREFNNEKPITYLWICGFACPAGQDFHHNTDTDDEDEYCDFRDLVLLDKLWELSGTVDEYGWWCWEGEGKPTDERANAIYSIKAG
jgi:hypothetical protein